MRASPGLPLTPTRTRSQKSRAPKRKHEEVAFIDSHDDHQSPAPLSFKRLRSLQTRMMIDVSGLDSSPSVQSELA